MKELISTLPQPQDASIQEIQSTILSWRGIKAQRLERARETKELQKEEDLVYSWILAAFERQGLDGMVVAGKSTGLQKASVLSVKDRAALTRYIKENGYLSLLEFRLSQKTAREMVEDGVEIPGLEEVEVFSLYNRQA